MKYKNSYPKGTPLTAVTRYPSAVDKARLKVSHASLSQNRVRRGAKASVLYNGKRFGKRHIAAAFRAFVDRQRPRRIQFTSRKINVFSGIRVAVNEAREQAPFCQFAIHDSYPHKVKAV